MVRSCVCVLVAALQAPSFYNLFKPPFTEHWLWARICANFKQICILKKKKSAVYLLKLCCNEYFLHYIDISEDYHKITGFFQL